MTRPTDEQRAAYVRAQRALAYAEGAAKPAIDKIQADYGIPALRTAFEAAQDQIGDELVGACIFCDKPLFCEDDFVTGDEIMCMPCNDKAWAEMTPEDRAARIAEIEEEESQ